MTPSTTVLVSERALPARRARLALATAAVAAVTAGALLAGAPAYAAGSSVQQVLGGKTVLTTTPGVVDALTAAGVKATFDPQLDTKVTQPGGKTVVSSAFRVTGGKLDLANGRGHLDHTGAITFTKGSKSVTISTFFVSIGGTSKLSAVVNGGSRATILSLDLSKATIDRNPDVVRVNGIQANLTKVAADALDSALGTTVFTPGLSLGSVRTVVVVGR